MLLLGLAAGKLGRNAARTKANGLVRSKFSPFYTTVINVVFWTASLVPASFAVWDVQQVKTYEDSRESGVEDIVEQVDEKRHEPSRL